LKGFKNPTENTPISTFGIEMEHLPQFRNTSGGTVNLTSVISDYSLQTAASAIGNCNFLPTEIVSIAGRNMTTNILNCNGTHPLTNIMVNLKEKFYASDLADRILVLYFSAFSTPEYDKHIMAFEDSIKTIKFTK
jgi:hypothetical protein